MDRTEDLPTRTALDTDAAVAENRPEDLETIVEAAAGASSHDALTDPPISSLLGPPADDAKRAADERLTHAFRYSSYRTFWTARVFAAFATQMVGVAVGWQVYAMTSSTLALGIIGLFQFAPVIALVLVTGAVADRYSRRGIMRICLSLQAVVAACLLILTVLQVQVVLPIYIVLLLVGIARAFYGPANSSIVTGLVPSVALADAITWLNSSGQIATIVGPVTGGILYGFAPVAPYAVSFVLFATAAIMMGLLKVNQPTGGRRKTIDLATMVAGFRYVWGEKVVLGAISLDLFAVLLGGATALLPAIARDILHTGPWGLGLLRAAPAVGALAAAGVMSLVPIRNHAGVIMFTTVTLFGVATTAFGVSTALWLTVLAGAVMGATDMVSMVVRETLIQLWTPNEMRGRVGAVDQVFTGASNEIGAFRAGTVAAFVGVVPAVVLGGIGTIVVSLLWSRMFPQLRTIKHFGERPVAD